jgi:hypothetical protein
MRDLLRRRLAEALAPDGWVPATPSRESKHVLANLVRPLEGDIAATAAVDLAVGIPDRLPVRITGVHVGVSYEPLRRLWPLLGDDYELAVLDEPVWPDEPDDWDEDDPGERQILAVSSAAEAERALDTITDVIRRAAVPFAEQHGSVEGLLGEFGYDESQGRAGARPVALLAAAGRFDEARAALARYDTQTGDRRWDREATRFKHQVGRYIDRGGDPLIIPSEPPPPEIGTGETPSVSEIWHESRAKRAAVRAVRAMGPETGRAELRAALERELAARGLTESPLWFEQTLDHLHDSPLEQAQRFAQGVGSAADLAFQGIRAIRRLCQHRSLPDVTPPAWLEPPDRAVYPVTRQPRAEWTEVQPYEHVAPYLKRAYAAIPRLIGPTAMATAWLDWDEPPGGLVVSLGAQRVGTVSPAAATAYRKVMDRATERDELPYVPARLTPRSGHHLLEIQLPDRRARGHGDA